MSPEETMSQEDIQKSISAAFDSVNLINQVITGTAMEDEAAAERQSAVDRNVEHLSLMLGKEWFADGLTEDQRTDIDTCILTGKAFVAE